MTNRALTHRPISPRTPTPLSYAQYSTRGFRADALPGQEHHYREPPFAHPPKTRSPEGLYLTAHGNDAKTAGRVLRVTERGRRASRERPRTELAIGQAVVPETST